MLVYIISTVEGSSFTRISTDFRNDLLKNDLLKGERGLRATRHWWLSSVVGFGELPTYILVTGR